MSGACRLGLRAAGFGAIGAGGGDLAFGSHPGLIVQQGWWAIRGGFPQMIDSVRTIF
jgi:hypothetical protein